MHVCSFIAEDLSSVTLSTYPAARLPVRSAEARTTVTTTTNLNPAWQARLSAVIGTMVSRVESVNKPETRFLIAIGTIIDMITSSSLEIGDCNPRSRLST